MSGSFSGLNRRAFLRNSAYAAGAIAGTSLAGPSRASALEADTGLKLVDRDLRIREATWNGQSIFSYNYVNDQVPLDESPKPYFHPLRTLGGSVVTPERPNDHPWQKGLGMNLTEVGEANFWGGPSYRKNQGYTWIPNHGRQRHVQWMEEHCAGTAGSLTQQLAWESGAGELLLSESRRIGFDLNLTERFWTLNLEMDIRNATSRPLDLGSYASNHGLVGSFYTGLFWRLPREFLEQLNLHGKSAKGSMLSEGNRDTEEKMHGSSGRWVALTGSVDNVLEPVTLLMIDRSSPDMSSPLVFIRQHLLGVGLPFLGNDSRSLAAAGSLKLRYQLVLADGHWPKSKITAYCRDGMETKAG